MSARYRLQKFVRTNRERVVAVVQLEPGAQADAAELVAHCRAKLARYKVPDEIRFEAELPRTPMGKIRKHELGRLFE